LNVTSLTGGQLAVSCLVCLFPFESYSVLKAAAWWRHRPDLTSPIGGRLLVSD
jgi:hypothetical protein